MKRIIIFALALVNITLGVFAQSDFFYSANGEKENFKIRKDKVVLKTKSKTEAKTLSKRTVFRSAYDIHNTMIIGTIDTLKTTPLG